MKQLLVLFSLFTFCTSSYASGDTAVIIVDAFLVSNDNWAPSNLDSEIEMMEEVLIKANDLNIPVFEFSLMGGRPTNPKLMAHYRDENWLSIKKNGYSAFTVHGLDKLLSQKEISKLIIMGFNQKLCVRETVIDALTHGLEVYTSFDVIQGHKIETDDLVREFYKEKTHLMPGSELYRVFLDQQE